MRGIDPLAIVGLAIALPIGVGAGGLVLLLPSCVVFLTIAVFIRLVSRRHVDKALEDVRMATVRLRATAVRTNAVTLVRLQREFLACLPPPAAQERAGFRRQTVLQGLPFGTD
jgi:chromate transport protein ChrA